jgi:hypothetical protein
LHVGCNLSATVPFPKQLLSRTSAALSPTMTVAMDSTLDRMPARGRCTLSGDGLVLSPRRMKVEIAVDPRAERLARDGIPHAGENPPPRYGTPLA